MNACASTTGRRAPVQAKPLRFRRPRVGGGAYLRFAPLIFFQAYLLASLVVLAFGPVDLEIRNPWVLYPYVLLGQVFILAGYFLGTRTRPTAYSGGVARTELLKLAIVTSLVIIPATVLNSNNAGVSLATALSDPGAAYRARLEALTDRSQAPVVAAARAVCGPVTGLLLPLGLLFRHRTTKFWRFLWAGTLLGGFAESIFVGAAKAMFDVILVAPWLVWLRLQHVAEDRSQTGGSVASLSSRPRPTRRWLVAAVTLLAFVGGMKYFSHSRQSRYGLSGDSFPAYTTDWSESMYGVPLPAQVEYPVYMVSQYISHGYVGLSECLELPYKPCYGLGHSKFMLRYAGLALQDPEEFQRRAYPFHLESVTGYDASRYWHTIYPWLASDLTFPGALLAIGMLAYLLARVWNDTLIARNPIAGGLLGQMLLLFYYVPANNIRMMFSEELFTFWGLLVAWMITKRRLAESPTLSPPHRKHYPYKPALT